MSHRKITFDECLPVGTPVRVGIYRGVVVSSEIVDAANGGKIALNSIEYHEKMKRGFGSQHTWETLKTPTKPQGVNYASILVIE